ncbi:MAG: hypothetical protein AB7T38_10820 [Nitrospirales bacterium]
MQRLDLHNPEVPDLQFVLMVSALCTANLESLNAPQAVRDVVFDRCWALLHEKAPPQTQAERVLDLRTGDDTTLEALVNMIRTTFEEYGYTELTWDQPPSPPTRDTTPEARPLVERLEKLYPPTDES